MTWTLPELGILEPNTAPPTGAPERMNPNRVHEVLTNAGVEAEEVTVHVAPQVYRYLVKLEAGADPKKVERLADSIALAVAAPVRYAGVEDGRVVVEQTRRTVDAVGLREAIGSSEALIRLGIPLGTATNGLPLIARLAEMPHMLVAGATGSGKSVFLTSALTSLLLRNTPDDMRLVLIDPKRVELAAFEKAPHVNDFVTEVAHAGPVLRRIAEQMDLRYETYRRAGVKSFEEYAAVAPDGERQARMVVVVDELADLMLSSSVCEKFLVRLAQLGRAAGIHLILATQHPEAKVLVGQLRLNIPARVVFAVQSHVASKVALDETGAEKLRGQGDGLFKAPRIGKPIRFQAPVVSAADVARVVAHWARQAELRMVDDVPVTRFPQPVDEPVHDDDAATRAELDAWWADAAAEADSAVASLSPMEILGDAGFSPLVIDALAAVLTEKITTGVAEYIKAMVPSNPVNTTEGDGQ